jgi:hypothetical protein
VCVHTDVYVFTPHPPPRAPRRDLSHKTHLVSPYLAGFPWLACVLAQPVHVILALVLQPEVELIVLRRSGLIAADRIITGLAKLLVILVVLQAPGSDSSSSSSSRQPHKQRSVHCCRHLTITAAAAAASHTSNNQCLAADTNKQAATVASQQAHQPATKATPVVHQFVPGAAYTDARHTPCFLIATSVAPLAPVVQTAAAHCLCNWPAQLAAQQVQADAAPRQHKDHLCRQ